MEELRVYRSSRLPAPLDLSPNVFPFSHHLRLCHAVLLAEALKRLCGAAISCKRHLGWWPSHPLCDLARARAANL